MKYLHKVGSVLFLMGISLSGSVLLSGCMFFRIAPVSSPCTRFPEDVTDGMPLCKTKQTPLVK